MATSSSSRAPRKIDEDNAAKNLKRSGRKLSYSGHETFPVRHGWLKKVFDAVKHEGADAEAAARIFTSEEAIGRFGVGKNMVASMQHWAIASKVVSTPRAGTLKIEPLGNILFDDQAGFDPFLDYPASLWLLHWRIATNLSFCTTWYFAFNVFGRTTFDKEQLETGIIEFARERQDASLKLPSAQTVQRDIDCFIGTYAKKTGKRDEFLEDSIECPLIELGLILPASERGTYTFDIGPKPTLDAAIFYFALVEFIDGLEEKTANLEQLTHREGSPGRVFKLSENDVAQYLARIEDSSSGRISWQDSAGIRQIQIRGENLNPYDFLEDAYGPSNRMPASKPRGAK